MTDIDLLTELRATETRILARIDATHGSTLAQVRQLSIRVGTLEARANDAELRVNELEASLAAVKGVAA